MEQSITLYRYHNSQSQNCVHAYTESLYEGPNKLPDCKCPIYGRGHLRNESGRINNKTLGKKGEPVIDWDVARSIRERWLKQGNTAAESSMPTDPIIGNKDDNLSGIGFFIESKTTTEVAGTNTMKKYNTLFVRRLIPWCAANGITHVKQLDHSTTVQAFFNSWKNLRNPLKPIQKNTKRSERERLSSFLNFWKEKRVLTANYAGPKAIRLGKETVQPKIGPTEQELSRIMDTFELWEDEYGHIDTQKARMVTAFAYTLRDIGQRISDVAMLGPHNIEQDGEDFFISLTQIKTGKSVKVPIERETVERLGKLPFRGVTLQPFIHKSTHGSITYPAGGYWFWTGKADLTANSNAWSMDMGRVLDKAYADYHQEAASKSSVRALKLFKTRFTAHSFRHYFAISALSTGEVSLEMVAEWLGDDVKTVKKYYGHANKDYHDESARKAKKVRDALKARRDALKPTPKKIAAKQKMLEMKKAG